MDEEKKIGLFSAVYNVGKAFSEDTEITDNSLEFSDLTKKDFEDANVTLEDQKELGDSLEKAKIMMLEFANNFKAKIANKMAKNKVEKGKENKEDVEQEDEGSKKEDKNIDN